MMNVRLTSYGASEIKLGQLRHHVFMMKLEEEKNINYRAFCGGSIIQENRVLSSAHCFYTNQKRAKYNKSSIKAVGGIVATLGQFNSSDGVQQWRTIDKIYTQKFFRFPAYNLAVVQIEKPWVFNDYVNKIPYASLDQDFDGICIVTVVRPAKSWASPKFLFTETFKMLPRAECESRLLKSLTLSYCTDYDSRKMLLRSIESEGGGLICTETGDPNETDVNQGLLVGVTSLIYMYLPTLHHKISPFHRWVSDSCRSHTEITNSLLLLCLAIKYF